MRRRQSSRMTGLTPPRAQMRSVNPSTSAWSSGRNARTRAKGVPPCPVSGSHVMAATDLLWFSGDDQANLALLALGATGVVSVVGHVAGDHYRALVEAVDAGDLAEARRIHVALIPVVDAIMTTSQGAIMAKAALVELGVIESAAVRLPLVESPPEHLERLRAALATLPTR